MRIYYILGTVLDTWNTVVNKIKIPTHAKLMEKPTFFSREKQTRNNTIRLQFVIFKMTMVYVRCAKVRTLLIAVNYNYTLIHLY